MQRIAKRTISIYQISHHISEKREFLIEVTNIQFDIIAVTVVKFMPTKSSGFA